MELTQADCENLIDALQEWDDAVGPKELGNNEVGLDSDRFEDLMKRLLVGPRRKNLFLQHKEVSDGKRTDGRASGTRKV